MNNALNKLHYTISLLILVGLFFMPIFRKDDLYEDTYKK